MHIQYIPKNEAEAEELDADSFLGAELEYELQQTDYIVIKIAEAEALGDHAEAERIRTQHAETIERRAKLRNAINSIKAKWEHRT